MATKQIGPYKHLPFSNNCDVCQRVYFRTIVPFNIKGTGPHAPNSHLFGYQIDNICLECLEIVEEVLREVGYKGTQTNPPSDPNIIREAQRK